MTSSQTKNNRYQQAKKITLWGAVLNAFLGIAKVVGGLLYHSHALVADGVHSYADLLTDMMVLFASKYGSQDADDRYHYGYQRVETAATLFLSLLLIFTGIAIAFEALLHVSASVQPTPGYITLVIAAISVLVNEALFHYTYRVGLKIRSDLLIANAWHHRSDAGSSAIVVIGLIGSLAGYPKLDFIAALLVGLLIVKMGVSYGWQSVRELMDSAVERRMLEDITAIITAFDDVKKVHQLRTRSMGGDIFIDVHILVSPDISVSEGHYIAQYVHHALVTQLERVKDVTVHVDSEDDENGSLTYHLPKRHWLEQTFLNPWQERFPEILNWTLHYVESAIAIDLVVGELPHELSVFIESELPKYPMVKSVSLFIKGPVVISSP